MLSTFDSDYKKLPPDIQDIVDEKLDDLKKDPRPAGLRFEKLKGHKNPSIYTIHITGNHSHKLSFEVIGDTARLRRIGTHKQIDRSP